MNDDKKFYQNQQDEKPRGMIFFIVIFTTIILFLFLSEFINMKQEEMTFQEFRKLVEDKDSKLTNVVYQEGKGFTFSKNGDKPGKEYFVSIPANMEQTPEFAVLLDKSGASYERKNRFLSEFMPHLLIIAGVFFLIYFFLCSELFIVSYNVYKFFFFFFRDCATLI